MLNTVKVPEQFSPLFQKAQEYVSKYFSLKKEDPSKGTIEIFGERYILVRAASMSVDFFGAIKNLYRSEGKEEAINITRSILFDIAHTIGKMDARNFHKKMNLIDPIEKLSAGPVHFAHSGWAFVDIFAESNPSPDENYCLVYDHPFSFESDAWMRTGRQAEFPICVMNAGYSSGWCEESFGVSLIASEIMCKAKGDQACRFVMAHPSKIELYIQNYLKKTPNIAGRVTTYQIPGLFERKWMEERLHESEANYLTIFNEANDAIFVHDPDTGNILDVNKQMCEMFGYTQDEALNLNVGAISSGEPSYTQQDALEWIRKARKDGPQVFKWKTKKKSGETFWVEVNLKLVRILRNDRVLAVVHDITERKQLNETLDRKQRNLEAIFDATPVGMMLVDERGYVKRVNDVLAKLVHRNFSEIINKQPGDGLSCINALNQAEGCGNGPSCLRCPVRNTFEDVLSSFKAIHGVEIQASLLIDGKEIKPWLELSAEPTFIDEIRHVVLSIQDITNRKHTEQALREAMAQAKMANTAKSQFLAIMSHEIRTPMNAIIGFTNLLAESELTNEQKEHLKLVKDSGQNLLRIIDDILDLSKIEARKLDVEIAECSLGQLLNSVESLMMPKAKIEGLDFKIIEDGRLPAQIRTDVTRVRQCLINLLGNAIKFTREGHIDLRVSLQEIENVPFVRFDVEDTGIGIPQDKQDEIFKTFVQADSSTSREFGGTGLGLAISKRLAELLSGQLTMTSEVGKGSVFSLTIPAGVDVTKQPLLDRQNTTSHIVTGTDETKQAKFSGHILVAEDVRTNQVLIKSLLKRLGLKVTIAEDGNEAVQKALSNPFDLIFMDIEMPNMNGYEGTKAIRKEGLKTPIIALTAYAMKGDDEKCFAAGCNDYISKPIEHEKLLQILNKYLSEENKDICRQIDSVKSDVEQLNQLCSETTPTQPVDEQYGEVPVDFAIIEKIYDDEDVLKETVKIFLEEAPQTIELLAEAIEARDSKNVKIHAHKLKGLARHVAARKLSDMLLHLETKGREEKLEGTEALFADIQTEFNKLKSFLSQPNWAESAEQ
ncbi:MAG: PAS domain S-box protein [Planctomycetes bacterium]|nr:PAS domain S-box protein [Planctomycetota bacterium]